MSFYSDIAATALSLLQKFGQTITLVRVTGASVDPVTGAAVAGTDASVTTTGVLGKFPDKLIDGTRILASDRRLILSNEQTPVMSDLVTVNGYNWTIIDIETVSPAGTDVIYICQVRR